MGQFCRSSRRCCIVGGRHRLTDLLTSDTAPPCYQPLCGQVNRCRVCLLSDLWDPEWETLPSGSHRTSSIEDNKAKQHRHFHWDRSFSSQNQPSHPDSFNRLWKVVEIGHMSSFRHISQLMAGHFAQNESCHIPKLHQIAHNHHLTCLQ